jgi:hypothetical protein
MGAPFNSHPEMGGVDADLQEKQASDFSLFNVAKVL